MVLVPVLKALLNEIRRGCVRAVVSAVSDKKKKKRKRIVHD